jgi:hypothetical protein
MNSMASPLPCSSKYRRQPSLVVRWPIVHIFYGDGGGRGEPPSRGSLAPEAAARVKAVARTACGLPEALEAERAGNASWSGSVGSVR